MCCLCSTRGLTSEMIPLPMTTVTWWVISPPQFAVVDECPASQPANTPTPCLLRLEWLVSGSRHAPDRSRHARPMLRKSANGFVLYR